MMRLSRFRSVRAAVLVNVALVLGYVWMLIAMLVVAVVSAYLWWALGRIAGVETLIRRLGECEWE